MASKFAKLTVRIYEHDLEILSRRATDEGKSVTTMANEILSRTLQRRSAAVRVETPPPADPLSPYPTPIKAVIEELASTTSLPKERILVELVSSILGCVNAEGAQGLIHGTLGLDDLKQILTAIANGSVAPLITEKDLQTA